MAARVDRETLEREVAAVRARGDDRDARALMSWAYELLGNGLMMSTAFGKSGMVLLHMVKDVVPDLPVFFLDTGFHFPETLEFAERIKKEWGLNLNFHRPTVFGEDFKREFGEALYERDPDLCCHKNKVEPFAALIDRFQGWIAGIRRDQSATRAEAETIEILESNKVKVQPLVMWTRARVEKYLREHDVPLNPLFERGYRSIGCAPCTSCPAAAADTGDERAGRWAGKEKTECGLHLFWKKRGVSSEESTPPDSAPPAADEGTADADSASVGRRRVV